MTTGLFVQASTTSSTHPLATVVTREAAQWLLARVAEGHEALFDLDIDERYWRVRRSVGAAVSCFEAPLPFPLSPGDLAAAMVRWASGLGLTARVSHELSTFRVALLRPAD